METLASSCLPMLSGQGLSAAMQVDDIQTLTGAAFLQTLTALSTGTAPGEAEASLLQGLTTAPESPAEEQEDAVDTAFALQWLPLTQFIASAIEPKSAPAIPTATGEGAGESTILQTAAAAIATSVAAAAATAGKKPAPAAEAGAVAVPDALLAGSDLASGTGDADFTAALFDAGSGGSLAGFADKPATGQLSGAQALAASASAVGAMQSGSSRTQGPLPGAEQAVQAHIRAPVHSARWAQEIGQRITLMAAAGQQNGTLTLTPENMGPLEVRINVSQDTASVWFGAQQADTRAALTDALPRLREMFAANGLSLGEANVSHEAPRQDSEAAKAFRGETGGSDDAGTRDLPRHRHHVSLGLIDTYA